MVEQMEIHPDHNDVINAAESTPRHAWESLHMLEADINSSAHTYLQEQI